MSSQATSRKAIYIVLGLIVLAVAVYLMWPRPPSLLPPSGYIPTVQTNTSPPAPPVSNLPWKVEGTGYSPDSVTVKAYTDLGCVTQWNGVATTSAESPNGPQSVSVTSTVKFLPANRTLFFRAETTGGNKCPVVTKLLFP